MILGARAIWLAPLALGACFNMCAVLTGCASANSSSGADLSRQASTDGSEPGALGALRQAALASHGAADVVKSLTDNVGPRLAGSKGDRAAVEWAIRTLTASGFSNVHTEIVTTPHWERGAESGAVVSPAWQPLSLTALGGSVGTPPSGIEAEVVEVDSLDALEKLEKNAAKGRIVFFNSVMNRARDGSGYGKAVSVRSLGAIRAAKLGAVGVVIRSIGTGSDRFPHTGAMRRDQGTPSIPAAALSIPDAELLHRLLAQHKSLRMQLKLGCRWLADVESANVIGEIPGTERADEIVLLGAHLDSWDLGTGAVDDGAGVGIVVHAGHLIASVPRRPRRTIRAVLFANEENGLSGARQYAQAHLDELPRHVLAMEADAGTGRAYAVRFLGAAQDRPRVAQLVAELKPLGLEMVEADAHGGADLSPMRPAGVPMLDIAQDVSTYFDVHHTANDTFDKIDPDALAQVSAAVAVIAYGFANLETEIGRVPEEKRNPEPSRQLRVLVPDDVPGGAVPTAPVNTRKP